MIFFKLLCRLIGFIKILFSKTNIVLENNICFKRYKLKYKWLSVVSIVINYLHPKET